MTARHRTQRRRGPDHLTVAATVAALAIGAMTVLAAVADTIPLPGPALGGLLAAEGALLTVVVTVAVLTVRRETARAARPGATS